MALGGIHHLWKLASASTGEASRWRVCYQQGLPRLVFCFLMFLTNFTTECNNIFHIKIYLDLVEILENILGNREEKKKENKFL